jgi:LysM repeat protein
MTAKRISRSIVVFAILAIAFASTGGALAWSGCPAYIIAQGGDTLDALASACSVALADLQAANPALSGSLVAGQVVHIPTGFISADISSTPQGAFGTYIVQQGDTLDNIAMRNNVSLGDLLAVNTQITNISMISTGQVINLPPSPSVQSSPIYTSPTDSSQSSVITLAYVTPSPVNFSQFGVLRVDVEHGLLVRSGPGTNNNEIKSPFVSAINRSRWFYDKTSVTVDSTGMVWVKVNLSPLTDGYSTGWIMVKDALGDYFTQPKISFRCSCLSSK